MIELIIPQRRRNLGHFEVQRVLPFAKRRMVGPYIFFDRMGPKDLAPVRTHSPRFYVHWQLRAGARASLPAEYSERAVYVASGTAEVAGQRVEAGSMAVLAPGKAVTVTALGDAEFIALPLKLGTMTRS